MDPHTLALLEFDKVRELLAAYAACSLGKELARAIEPSTDLEWIDAELTLVSEMVDALGGGQPPPFGGLHDVRLGVVHRTSSTGETVFIEPSAVAKLSAERVVLKGEEEREVRRILRKLTAEVARVAKQLTFALDILAKLDLITAKAKLARDFAMY